MKFGPVLDRADALGAEFVATGHYARRDVDPVTGRYRLRTAADRSKDQSYVLFPMVQDDLARLAAAPYFGRCQRCGCHREAHNIAVDAGRCGACECAMYEAP